MAAVITLSATQAGADPLGGLLRSIDRVAGSATKVAPVRTNRAAVSVSANAADLASMKAALDSAPAPGTAPARSLASARPGVERLLMTMAFATSAKALHGLNQDRLNPETYVGLDDDRHYTAMGLGGLMTHDRRTACRSSG
jgi:pectin methylesterase-like acyl-CoA thioesterase